MTASKKAAARQSLLAWMGWLIFAVAICAVSHHQGFKRTVVPSYRAASTAWLASRPIYELDSIHGFLYLPSAAALTVPFLGLPASAHELVFRALSIGFLAWATWRLASAVERATGRAAFLPMTFLVIPTAIGSAVAGQMNIALAAAMAAAAADMIEKRWNRAAIWLGLGFALKPQMAVFLVLAAIMFRPMRLRALIALVAALLVPFLFQSPHFVFEQYRLCWTKLQLSGNPTAVHEHFNDLFGLLSSFGLEVRESSQWIIRIISMALTVLCAWRGAQRRDNAAAVLMTLAWAACYLMLFNPRTEGGSYVIAAVPLAVFAVCATAPRIRVGEVSLLVCIAGGWTASFPISQALHQIAGKFVNTGPQFHFWLSPLLALVFVAYLLYLVRNNRGAVERSAPLLSRGAR
ncbi:MAG: glycosyltransferase family 87 protein [Chthoniobacterales bacterium]